VDWQWLVVTLAVTAAAAYVVRGVWRSLAGRKAGCSGGCACPAKTAPDAPAPLIPVEQVGLRRRR
jgi:hypothetical protein